jgi:hypothetical protein
MQGTAFFEKEFVRNGSCPYLSYPSHPVKIDRMGRIGEIGAG